LYQNYQTNNDGNTNEDVKQKPKKKQRIGANIDDATTKSSGTNVSRQDKVGIKNFTSNRILLADQAYYFDKYHCVLIIPIMDTKSVKNWEGKGYDAIVLASKFKRADQVSQSPASEVYQRIDARTGPLLFATKSECEMARKLFKIMILCVCKSSEQTFPKNFLLSKNDKKMDDLKKAFDKLNIFNPNLKEVVPVPKIKDWTEHMNVRKITFCASHESKENQHPAPDPVLLLGKSTSNWLQLQDIPLLPTCDDDSSLDSSNYTVTFSVEAAARGWNTESYKKPRVDEISFVPCDTCDESLSDDEE
jgi:hypothetical protein